MTFYIDTSWKNVENVVDAGLCMQCGACEAICPHGSINIQRDAHWRFFPVIKTEKYCGKKCKNLCIAVCPGVHEDPSLWPIDPVIPSNYEEWCIGPIKETWVGYSTDPDIRHRGSSGGVVTGLLVYLLEAGKIDGALIVGPISDNPYEHVISIARTREEIEAAWGSKYYPMPIGRHFNELKHKTQRFAVVLLGCHMRALRLIERRFKGLFRSVILRIGLICGYCSGFKAILDVAEEHGITDFSQVKRVDYRQGQWPGFVRLQTMEREVRISIYSFLERLPFTTNLRCMFCSDLMNSMSDITVGDAWLKEFTERSDEGLSIIAARTPQAARLIREAQESAALYLKPCTTVDFIRSQEKPFRYKMLALKVRYAFVEHLLGGTLPIHDRRYYKKNYALNTWNVLGNWIFLLTLTVFFKRDRLRRLFFKYVPDVLIRSYVRLIFQMIAHEGDELFLVKCFSRNGPVMNCEA